MIKIIDLKLLTNYTSTDFSGYVRVKDVPGCPSGI